MMKLVMTENSTVVDQASCFGTGLEALFI